MACLTAFLALFALLGKVHSAAVPTVASSTEALPALPTTCGDLVRSLVENEGYAYAKTVYDCFVTVPFNPAVGTRLVKYYEDTLQFQANLDNLASPEPGYQQPAVDLLSGLHSIQSRIDSGQYANEYQFEGALQNLLNSANDPHLSPSLGMTSLFSFGSVYGMVAISRDGVSDPEIYLLDDILDHKVDSETSWQPSPVMSVNGTDVNTFVTRYAALNSPGSVEPHADWNMFFESPVRDAFQDSYSLFTGGATFYPGDDLDIVLRNGTVVSTSWVAVYNGPLQTGPLETGGDFYNLFVLGLLPASWQEDQNMQTSSVVAGDDGDDDDDEDDGGGDDSGDSVTVSNPLSISSFGAFPETADVVQANYTSMRYITGYFMRDNLNAAISIPTFDAADNTADDFANAVEEFLDLCRQKNVKKIIIDLQQNDGGDELLAYSTFRQFFPNREPFGGSNMRKTPFVNITGSAFNEWYDQQPENSENRSTFAGSDWVVTNRRTANGNGIFASWSDFYGPSATHTTEIQRYNLSDKISDAAVLGSSDIPASLVHNSASEESFPRVSDMVILSDASCTSACALFVEMMHYEQGVKTVVIGGRPQPGPMQTVGGSRGASLMNVHDLDGYVDFARILDNVDASVLPDRSDQSVLVQEGAVTLRNQVRYNDQTPVQMLYDAADCRIHLSFSTIYNMTNLWNYAADAVSNPGLCVADSTGFATTASSQGAPSPPRQQLSALDYNEFGALHVTFPDGSELPPFRMGPVPDGDPETGAATQDDPPKGGGTSLFGSDPQYIRTRDTSREGSDCGVAEKKRGLACRRPRFTYTVVYNDSSAKMIGAQQGKQDGTYDYGYAPGILYTSLAFQRAYTTAYIQAYKRRKQQTSKNDGNSSNGLIKPRPRLPSGSHGGRRK